MNDKMGVGGLRAFISDLIYHVRARAHVVRTRSETSPGRQAGTRYRGFSTSDARRIPLGHARKEVETTWRQHWESGPGSFSAYIARVERGSSAVGHIAISLVQRRRRSNIRNVTLRPFEGRAGRPPALMQNGR